jgi:hypothetical protein
MASISSESTRKAVSSLACLGIPAPMYNRLYAARKVNHSSAASRAPRHLPARTSEFVHARDVNRSGFAAGRQWRAAGHVAAQSSPPC